MTEFSYWIIHHGLPLRLCNIISIKWYIFWSSLWSYEKLQFSPCLSVRCFPIPVAQCRSATLWTTTAFSYHPFHQVSQSKKNLVEKEKLRKEHPHSCLLPCPLLNFILFCCPFLKHYFYLLAYLDAAILLCRAQSWLTGRLPAIAWTASITHNGKQYTTRVIMPF